MEIIVGINDCGQRIDKFLAERVGMTRSAVVNYIQDGCIKCNEKIAQKNYILKQGDSIIMNIPAPRETEAVAEDIELDVVYEDDSLIVINKPQGMVVHPAAGNYSGTLVNALLNHCQGKLSGINGVIRPGIVHRIDKDTSGLLVAAKTNEAHIKLAEQIKTHSFLRVYNGIIYGKLKEHSGRIDLPIGRDLKDRKKMCVTLKNSKNAVTEYTVLQEYRTFSLVEFKLYTGRTHQIRVHMAYKGHAIYGDKVYSPKNVSSRLLTGQYLHAKKLGFLHPKTDAYIEFDSPLPERFTKLLQSEDK